MIFLQLPDLNFLEEKCHFFFFFSIKTFITYYLIFSLFHTKIKSKIVLFHYYIAYYLVILDFEDVNISSRKKIIIITISNSVSYFEHCLLLYYIQLIIYLIQKWGTFQLYEGAENIFLSTWFSILFLELKITYHY